MTTPIPASSIPRHAGDVRLPPRRGRARDRRRRVARAARAQARPPPTSRRVHLLLIDVQKDFCFPEGSLYVAGRCGTGAIDDSRRIAEFIYRNLGAITDITTTLDTHLAYQIFFPSFWLDQADAAARPRTARSPPSRSPRGEVRPNPGDGEVAVRRQLHVAVQAGAVLLRGARARRQVPALPVAAALPARLRRPRARRRDPRGAPVPRVRARRAVARRGQGRQPADRELLGAAPRGAVALRRRRARPAQHAVPPDAARRRRGRASPARPRATA